MATHYAVLKVATDAPIEVIRAAYRVLVARCHPDRRDGDADAVRHMQRVTEAWRVLSDPASRAHYDSELRRAWRRRASDDAEAAPPVPVTGGPDAAEYGPADPRRRAAATYASFAALGR